MVFFSLYDKEVKITIWDAGLVLCTGGSSYVVFYSMWALRIDFVPDKSQKIENFT